MTRDTHCLPWDASSSGHRLTRTCPCLPVACTDLAEPARVVFVHRVTVPVANATSERELFAAHSMGGRLDDDRVPS